MRRLLIASTLAVAACGGSSPAPSPTPPAPTSYTITGSVNALQTGSTLSGVTVNGVPADGEFALTAGAGMLALEATGASIVPRKVWTQVNGPARVDLTAIAQDGTFDLDFYRQFARGSRDNGSLQPLRHLTSAPRIYLRTVDDAGTAISESTLALTEAVIRETAPVWSAGAFGVAGFERGTDSRENVTGYLTVKWVHGDESCGLATVGTDGGWMQLNYVKPNCRCGDGAAVVRHELGHAFGYWHTDDQRDVMATSVLCGQQISARERYHARIVYSRPVGNVDPDSDPSSAVTLRPMVVR